MSSPARTRNLRAEGIGRGPGGITGEVRDKNINFVVAPGEKEIVMQACVKRGFSPTPAGVRDMLLSMIQAEAELAGKEMCMAA